jgi:hypothetical protein
VLVVQVLLHLVLITSMEIKAVIRLSLAQQQLVVVMALHLAKVVAEMEVPEEVVVQVILPVALGLLVKATQVERLIIHTHKHPAVAVELLRLVKMLLVAQVVMVVLELHLQLQVLQ